MDIKEEIQDPVENCCLSVIIPETVMLKQEKSASTCEYGVQSIKLEPVEVASSSSGEGRGQAGARTSLCPPPDNQGNNATPSSSTVHQQKTCCIIDKNQRCHQYAGRHVYNKGMQKRVKAVKSVQIKADSRARHIGMCDYHKTMIEEIIKKYSSCNSDDTESDDEDGIDVKSSGIDFSRFPLATLLRYKKFFSIPGQLSKGQLVDAITEHFKNMPVLEIEEKIKRDFVLKLKYGG